MKKRADEKAARPDGALIATLCAQWHEGEDGVSPRKRSGAGPSTRKLARKRGQLCAQIAQAASFALDELAQRDASLLGLVVQRVEPAPDASTLRVVVSPGPGWPEDEPVRWAALEDALKRGAGLLRLRAAEAIHRKRAPQLIVSLVPA